MATRYYCDPNKLETRDEQQYQCRPKEECPSEEYLIKKYNLPMDDENSSEWMKLVGAALRHNKNVDTGAKIGKMLDF